VGLLDSIGLGIDVQDVAAFEDHAQAGQQGFLARVFTERERTYCLGMPAPAQHFAVRFAAKEAVIKALAPFVRASFEEIEIERGEDGQPRARLALAAPGRYVVRLSLSHSESQAVAVALLERIPDGE
jgi:holo-[acyl-carrier protein] synthase